MRQVETIDLPFDPSEFTEIIDVRSPSEYAIDHIPGAVNLPVLSDAQRHEVGTLYVDEPFLARRLGAQLISENAAAHLANHLAQQNKDYAPLLYCWRGGMRSHSIAHIMRQVGWRARVIAGGYKAFRNWMQQDTERLLQQSDLRFTVLAGQTGVGKTRLLHLLDAQNAQVLDLEGLANHRGSVLGLPPGESQPSQKYFESSLWHKLTTFDPSKAIFVEAESNRIGQIHCPPPLWRRLSEGRVVHIDMPANQRAQLLLDDYPHFTQQPDTLLSLLEKLTKLRGAEQINEWREMIEQENWVSFVTSMLENHYDLAYRKAGDGKSNYPAPSHSIALDDFSAESMQAACDELLSLGE